MKKKIDLLGIMLAVLTGTAILVCMLVRAFSPTVILPKLDFSSILLLSLAALAVTYYFNESMKKFDFKYLIYAFLIFGIFPWLACFSDMTEALKTAILGAIVFTVANYVFALAVDRLSTSPASKLAPVVTAFTIYLASQCLVGIVSL